MQEEGGKSYEMADSKKRKRILLIVLITMTALFLLGVYMLRTFPEQFQGLVKNKVISDVMKNEAELNDIIAEMSNPELPKNIDHWLSNRENIISYTELDNDKITNIYNKLSLMYIRNYMDNSECGYVQFTVLQHPVCLVWGGEYFYGFYYSEEDRPVDIYSGEIVDSNTKVYVDNYEYEYWYRTEKIADNWWYFDTQLHINMVF